MTLKIIIAEDEHSFRRGIVEAIDWQLYDVEIAGEAENGREALELMKQQPAELLLTDIRMPHMNGLDLIRKAKEAGFSFHSVLLTGYNEFDYAKEAISLGVSDYLLKPCMPHDILRVVLDVKKKIEASEQEERALTEINRTWSRSIQLLKNQVLSQWITQPVMPLEDRTMSMREYNLSLQPESIVVGRIELDTAENNHGTRSNRDLELLRYAIMNIADETLKPLYSKKLEVFRFGEEMLWIGNCPEGANNVDHGEMMALLKKNLESYLMLSVSLALSSIKQSVNDAKIAYEEASHAMGVRFYQGNGGVFFYTDMKSQQQDKPAIWEDPYLDRTEKELLAHLQSGQYGGAVDVIEAGISYLKNQPSYPRPEIIWRVNGLIMELRRLATERYSVSIEWQNNLVNWMESIPTMKTLDECSAILQKIVQSIVEAASNMKQLHRTVQATIELISTKYHTNLTLEIAAKETFVSNSYLSWLFKQELGVNFLDYLHQFRIERAKELLKSSYKIYAVAKLVGYSEERHFSSTFKKWTGMTPSQYQKSYLQEYSL